MKFFNFYSEDEQRMEKYKKHKIPANEDLGKIHYKLVGKFNDIDFYLVDGTYIRDNIDIDFTMGGNPGRYKYVPENEIWLDKDMGFEDLFATAFHEYFEMMEMEKNKKSYEKSHDEASNEEKIIRNIYDLFKNMKDKK